MGDFIDPFGAPETFVNDIAYLQMAGPGLVRFVLYAEEGSPTEKIIRAKILIPAAVIPSCIARTTAFLAGQAVDRLAGPAAARFIGRAPLH